MCQQLKTALFLTFENRYIKIGLQPSSALSVSDEPGQRLITLLTDFVNLYVCISPRSVDRSLYLLRASLSASAKKDNGIRSIAVGCTLRRLVINIACRFVTDRIAARPTPIQLGFGIKQGAQASAHAAVRRFLQDLGPGQAV